jgi:hypothetical protein
MCCFIAARSSVDRFPQIMYWGVWVVYSLNEDEWKLVDSVIRRRYAWHSPSMAGRRSETYCTDSDPPWCNGE